MQIPPQRYNLLSKTNFIIYSKMRRLLGNNVIPYLENNPEKMMKILKA